MNNRILLQNSIDYYNKEHKIKIINKIKKLSNLENPKFLDNGSLKEYVSNILNYDHLKEVLNIIEEYEYRKISKYSILFKINEFQSIQSKIIKEINNKDDCWNLNQFDYISNKLEKPTYKEDVSDSNIFDLKFSLKKNKENGDSYKYYLKLTFYKDLEIIELNLNSIESDFMENENFYNELIESVKNWFIKIFNISLKNYDIFKIVENIFNTIYFNEDKYPEINVFLQYGSDEYLGKIKLRTNTQTQMPILHSLKELTTSFENPNDQEKVINFIKNIINSYDYYKKGFKYNWFDKNNSIFRKLIFIFSFNHNNSKYTYIHYYANSLDRRFSNEIIRYFINFK